MIGKPLWFDKSTRLGQRLGYPKVCVEVGLDTEFPESLKLVPDQRPAFYVQLEYCNLLVACKKCHQLGHDSLEGVNAEQMVNSSQQEKEQTIEVSDSEGVSGAESVPEILVTNLPGNEL
ncbi:unnamed protein product [Linum tenue]|uniref:Uncharacterized protein n=1 Tax=Linum tenue TaxID=586396 RepID=A0AAV0HJB3_9ROSI|nr:unnamed protein product [Linum tenue]